MRQAVVGTCSCCIYARLGGDGSPFDLLLKKQERRLAWLTILLHKRGQKKDLELAERINIGVWP